VPILFSLGFDALLGMPKHKLGGAVVNGVVTVVCGCSFGAGFKEKVQRHVQFLVITSSYGPFF